MGDLIITYFTTTGTSDVDPGFVFYVVDTTAGDITLTLPDITSDGFYFGFKRFDTSANSFTIQGHVPAHTIDGSASLSFNSGDIHYVAALNGVWYIVG